MKKTKNKRQNKTKNKNKTKHRLKIKQARILFSLTFGKNASATFISS